MGYLTTTKSGEVIQFTSPKVAGVEGLKVHFSPKQAGSGDPSPTNVRPITGWTGVEAYKAGKNLFDISTLLLSTGTLSGNSLTDTVGNLYNAFGPHTNGIPYTNYKLRISISITAYHTGSSTANTRGLTIKVLYDDGTTANIAYFSNSIGKTPTVSTGTSAANKQVVGMYIDYGSDSTNTWTISNFIIVPGSTVPTSYEPYQGETIPVTFPTLGKNLLNTSTNISEGKLMDTVGELTDDINYNTTDYISLPANQTYTFSCKNNSLEEEQTRIRLIVFEPDTKVFKSRVINKKKNPNEDYSYTFSLYTNSLIRLSYHSTDYNIQLEYGDTATTYEPYNSNNTVYGGYVDLAAGEVVAEWCTITFDETTPMRAYSSDYRNLGLSCNASYWLDSLNAPKARTYIPYSVDGYCDKLPYLENNYAHTDRASASNTTFEVGLAGTRTEEAYLDWMSENGPITIAYEIQTPIHYPLTPTQIQTLIGLNTFYSNANSIDVEYDIAEPKSIIDIKKRIAANTPHIATPTSARLVNFSTDMIAPLKECKVHFTPVQDLHGYDSPWPAGGGKNIAKPYDNSYVSSTYISFDYSAANGTFRCYGTASASSTHSSPSATNAFNNDATFTLPVGTYTLSIIDGDGANIYAQCVSSTETVLAETTSYTTFTTNEPLTVFVRLKVAAAATVDKTVKIQLEKGSSATSYVPYENVCPISGWTGCEAYRAGKNLWNPQIAPTMIDCYDATGTAQQRLGYIYRLPFGSYTLSAVKINPADCYIYGNVLNADGSLKSFFYFVAGTTTVYSPKLNLANGEYLVVYDMQGYTTTKFSYVNIQLELGTTPTIYTPYTGSTVPLDWTDSAGTIHGGYIDLMRGEVVEEYAYLGLSTIDSWNSDAQSSAGYVRFISAISTKASWMNIYCDALPVKQMLIPQASTEEGISGYTMNNAIYISISASRLSGDLSTQASRNQAFKNYLVANPINIVYPLATPIHHTIDPVTLRTLRGVNNIWANTNGTIDLSYWTH